MKFFFSWSKSDNKNLGFLPVFFVNNFFVKWNTTTKRAKKLLWKSWNLCQLSTTIIFCVFFQRFILFLRRHFNSEAFGGVAVCYQNLLLIDQHLQLLLYAYAIFETSKKEKKKRRNDFQKKQNFFLFFLLFSYFSHLFT